MTARQDTPALGSNVVSVFRRRPVADGEPEIKVSMAPASTTGGSVEAAVKSALDLTGKTKVWFMLGAGNAGKGVEVRWLIGRMQEQGRQAILAALDPGNRSLATWFEGVEQPPCESAAGFDADQHDKALKRRVPSGSRDRADIQSHSATASRSPTRQHRTPPDHGVTQIPA